MPPHPEQQKKTSQLGGLNKNISSRDTSEVSELPPALGSCGNPLGRAGFPPLPKHPQEISPENMPNKLQGEKHSSHPLCPTKKKTSQSDSIIFVKKKTPSDLRQFQLPKVWLLSTLLVTHSPPPQRPQLLQDPSGRLGKSSRGRWKYFHLEKMSRWKEPSAVVSASCIYISTGLGSTYFYTYT